MNMDIDVNMFFIIYTIINYILKLYYNILLDYIELL